MRVASGHFSVPRIAQNQSGLMLAALAVNTISEYYQ
jgi:hypothetical protein